MAEPEKPSDVAALAVQLLSAYLSNNTVAPDAIAELIRTTKAALVEEVHQVPEVEAVAAHVPAVSVRKSLAASGHILSMIDGKPYKVLKRHLSKHGLTPDAYRERYGLPSTYPMVAPDFAAQRRSIAEKIGLGSKGRSARAAAATAAPVAIVSEERASTRAAAEAKATSVKAEAVEVAQSSAPKAKRQAVSKARVVKAKPVSEAIAPVEAPSPERKLEATKPIIAAQLPPKGKGRKSVGSGKAKASKAATKAAAEPAASAKAPSNEFPAGSAEAARGARRGGKLGLFGKSDKKSGGAVAEQASGASNGEGATDVSAKPARQKRMARGAKPQTLSEADSKNDASVN